MVRTAVVHQRDPDARPDSEFEVGAFHHLVPGNAGRMLDARRTPIRVDALCSDIGSWRCEVMAFEDRGAMWTLPVESVTRFQFALGSAYASQGAVADLESQARRFGTPLIVERDPERARVTSPQLERRSNEAAAWLARREQIVRTPVNADQLGGLSAIAVSVDGNLPRGRHWLVWADRPRRRRLHPQEPVVASVTLMGQPSNENPPLIHTGRPVAAGHCSGLLRGHYL